MPSHYLKQCWLIIKKPWQNNAWQKFCQNSNYLINKNAPEIIIFRELILESRPREQVPLVAPFHITWLTISCDIKKIITFIINSSAITSNICFWIIYPEKICIVFLQKHKNEFCLNIHVRLMFILVSEWNRRKNCYCQHFIYSLRMNAMFIDD